MTLYELATLMQTQVVIRYPDVNGAWYAGLEFTEIKEDIFLASFSGRGASPEEALSQLVEEIKGKKLVVNGGGKNRRECMCPLGLTA